MMFFIHHVQTYRNVNRKGQEMGEFALAYERILIEDKRALDSLKYDFKDVIKKLNEKYPNQKTLKFNEYHDSSRGGQWSIKLGDDDSQPVCLISYSVVKGNYSFGDCSCPKEQKGGV